jgi:hypothetical protein
MTLAAPLVHLDRGAFLKNVAERLRLEPVLGPGIVSSVAKEILGSGKYKLATSMTVNTLAEPRHTFNKRHANGDG